MAISNVKATTFDMDMDSLEFPAVVAFVEEAVPVQPIEKLASNDVTNQTDDATPEPSRNSTGNSSEWDILTKERLADGLPLPFKFGKEEQRKSKHLGAVVAVVAFALQVLLIVSAISAKDPVSESDA